MIKKIALVFLVISLAATILYAEEKKEDPGLFSYFENAGFEKSFHLNYASLSLKDSGDQVYIGDMNRSGFGIGAHVAWLNPIGENLSFGPNVNFSYSQINDGSWYSLDMYQYSVGPIVKMELDENSYEFFLNYNLGLAVTEQETTVSGGTAPSGTFVSNIRGFILGFRGKMHSISENYVIGPYVTLGSLCFMSFEYKSLFGGSYTDKWVNIEFNYIEAGVSLFI